MRTKSKLEGANCVQSNKNVWFFSLSLGFIEKSQKKTHSNFVHSFVYIVLNAITLTYSQPYAKWPLLPHYINADIKFYLFRIFHTFTTYKPNRVNRSIKKRTESERANVRIESDGRKFSHSMLFLFFLRRQNGANL